MLVKWGRERWNDGVVVARLLKNVDVFAPDSVERATCSVGAKSLWKPNITNAISSVRSGIEAGSGIDVAPTELVRVFWRFEL